MKQCVSSYKKMQVLTWEKLVLYPLLWVEWNGIRNGETQHVGFFRARICDLWAHESISNLFFELLQRLEDLIPLNRFQSPNFKLLRSPRIDSNEPNPLGCVAWRPVRKPYSCSVSSHHILFKNSSTGLLKSLKIPSLGSLNVYNYGLRIFHCTASTVHIAANIN